MRIKIDPADKIFSKYIRVRDGRCVRCKREGEYDKQGLQIKGLQNSHFWGRKNESTRFDPENCDSLCYGCHQYFHGNPYEHVKWKKKRIGEERFKALELRHNLYMKKDRKLALLVAKKLLEEEVKKII